MTNKSGMKRNYLEDVTGNEVKLSCRCNRE